MKSDMRAAWTAIVGLLIGISMGIAIQAIFHSLEVAGGGPRNRAIAPFVGASFALGFWTLAYRIGNPDRLRREP